MSLARHLVKPPTITRRTMMRIIAGVTGFMISKKLCASEKKSDTMSSEFIQENTQQSTRSFQNTDVLLVLVSIHHKNTDKIARQMAKVLNAQISMPRQIDIKQITNYKIIGFGSGIYDQKHHRTILDFIDMLPQNFASKTFIFSTSGVSRKTCLNYEIEDPHDAIRTMLKSKGCEVIDEFNCAGWNTNSFLKLFGGINWGKPNSKDIAQAEMFAKNIYSSLL